MIRSRLLKLAVAFALVASSLLPIYDKGVEAATPWWTWTKSISTGTYDVKATGTYSFYVEGGDGGGIADNNGGNGVITPGGLGAYGQGTINLTKGTQLLNLVGGAGQTGSYGGIAGSYRGSGGGGSFLTKVVPSSPYLHYTGVYVEPLIVAGGGGGVGDPHDYLYSPILGTSSSCGQSPYYSTSGGCNGNGGTSGSGGAGGGFITNGGGTVQTEGPRGVWTTVNTGGDSFLNGGSGGNGSQSSYRDDGSTYWTIDGIPGGQGGGGASTYDSAGAGGGWSGGSTAPASSSYQYRMTGGGGGSYMSPSVIGGYVGSSLNKSSGRGLINASLDISEPIPTFSNFTTTTTDITVPSTMQDGLTYVVEISTDAATGWAEVLRTTAKTFMIPDLSEDTLYYVRIKVELDGLYSPYTATRTFKTASRVLEAAINAEKAAIEANTTMNTIISPKLTLVEGAVKDGLGNTALSMATLASQNASIQ